MIKSYFCFKNIAINFVDVILPIPVPKLFTYKITLAEANFLKKGMRVAVPFGKSKIYTAIVYRTHHNLPKAYEAKDIEQILDEAPIVTENQMKHWEWIADYYMATLGEVVRTALPSNLLLESETIITLNNKFTEDKNLSDNEFLIFESLQFHSQLNLKQVGEILEKKSVFPIIKQLLQKEVIFVKEQLYETYKPKFTKFLTLNNQYSEESGIKFLLEQLSKSPKQKEVLLTYFQLVNNQKNVSYEKLKKESNASSTILRTLIKKEIFDLALVQTDRVQFQTQSQQINKLSKEQNTAFKEINNGFKLHDTVLLQGITSSGKTELYIKLIQQKLKENKQVLYLLPEIALTTQLIERLKFYFGDYLSVYHSKYSLNERLEVWNNLLENKKKARLILGTRSAVLLPFSNLGLVVVDEEHETSYKQFDPAPRYHARDTALFLAKIHDAKTILGSATPSLESYFNAQNKKYEFVLLNTRFRNVQLPEINLIDLKEKHRKKRMKGLFSDELIKEIENSLTNNEQVILFQNRRGYAPVYQCEVCGNTVECPNCDVSLTYHHHQNQLHCHYCGYKEVVPQTCSACGSNQLKSIGFGTEQIALELKELFPAYQIDRMDFDTTRGKNSYLNIIENFEKRKIDILVGTQMLSKGLHFNHVSLVGVINADSMLNFPDFRAHERTFQLLVQVAGRAGREKKRGKVLIQTFNPFHQILQQVSTHNYLAMYKEQLNERWQYHYPPYFKIIKITLKHKNYQTTLQAANWLEKYLTSVFKENSLGPATPPISKIRNLYLQQFILKIPQNYSLNKTKETLTKIRNTFLAVQSFKSIRFIIDVDSY